ncbi:MAG: hypothetical protein PHT69_09045 [Bacteroidales bacterium]|nr:hypothetical protein [Bacteroidales bacterium]
MSKKVLSGFFIVSLVAVIFSSCGKYEDGPSFSLSTKKNRVVNTWKIEKIFVNDVDRTSLFQAFIDSYKVELTSDDKVVETLTSILGTQTNNGTWEFSSGKESIITTISGNKISYRILRLMSDEMWLEEMDGNNKYVRHFITFS